MYICFLNTLVVFVCDVWLALARSQYELCWDEKKECMDKVRLVLNDAASEEDCILVRTFSPRASQSIRLKVVGVLVVVAVAAAVVALTVIVVILCKSISILANKYFTCRVRKWCVRYRIIRTRVVSHS